MTDTERSWLVRGLQSLETGEYMGGGNWIDTKSGQTLPLDRPVDPRPYLDQIDGLRVISQCECGDARCHTVQFQNFRPGYSVAIVSYHTDDGRMLVIFVDDESGNLSELEII